MTGRLRRLATVDNFRDLAGPDNGFPVPGGRMRTRVLFRANRIQPDTADHAYLQGLALSAIHDLREQYEVAHHPDHPIGDAAWHHHPVGGVPREVVLAVKTPADMVEAMIELYRDFVREPARRRSFSGLLQRIATTEGPQLFHCAAGKDRTGWAAWILHHVAGVAEQTAVADYLLTDEYAASSRTATMEALAAKMGQQRQALLAPAWRCDLRYLSAARDAADVHFGGLDGYLADGLSLSTHLVERLRQRLVEAVN